jgi:hypothetical protein
MSVGMFITNSVTKGMGCNLFASAAGMHRSWHCCAYLDLVFINVVAVAVQLAGLRPMVADAAVAAVQVSTSTAAPHSRIHSVYLQGKQAGMLLQYERQQMR